MLGVNRSGLYYEPVGESEENLLLMRLLDEQYTRTPFYGSRKMTEWLATRGHEVNRKRVSRLMESLGLEAVYPKPKQNIFLSRAAGSRMGCADVIGSCPVKNQDFGNAAAARIRG